ncbi:hypothetical protein BBBOND_0206950 [Babesia bigemina]|uniref:Uncharacterized protein n=1 Tax=Babesia bigemina TaxID=5866 RepID=A0A061D696_BABBI|nr:hypothetical protein BBBOND_0206950 [Babesia bigemina]CDR95537.1 hypothetical protein BBBOND_0206950 [Babesia bigemina]|eukprot:XP_012767723.1 hypothetical protein BBBOND_0206950 [Babesia bigemina]
MATYSEIVHELYNLSAQGVRADDVRFRQLLSALDSAREKRKPVESEYYGMKGSVRNPVSSSQFERTLNQIDAVYKYLAVGSDVPPDLLLRCGVDCSTVNEKQAEKQSDAADILHYSEALHVGGSHWTPSLGWVEYNESLAETRTSYTLNAVSNLRSLLEFVMEKGSAEGMESVEALIRTLGMERFADRFRSHGMIRVNKFLAGLMRLERQLRLLSLQRTLKRALRMVHHFNVTEPSDPNLWHAATEMHGWGEHLAEFVTRSRECDHMRATLACQAAQMVASRASMKMMPTAVHSQFDAMPPQYYQPAPYAQVWQPVPHPHMGMFPPQHEY